MAHTSHLRSVRHMRIVCAVLACWWLAGCQTTPVQDPDTAAPELSKRFRNDSSDMRDEVSIPDAWWRQFGDAELDRLIGQALAGNPDLKIAELRVKQAMARADQVGAGGKPTVNLPMLAAQQSPGGTVGSVPVSSSSRTTQTSYQASLQVSYRVDLWGEQSSRDVSAEQQVLRARFESDNERRNVVAAVVNLYVTWLSLQDSIRLAQDNIEASEHILRQIELRYALGDATTSELEQQRGSLAIQRANLPFLLEQQEDTRSQIALALGLRSDEVVLPEAGLERLSVQSLHAGVPSSLLLRRPDVRAVEARMRSARADIDVARARFLPTLDLAAQGGRSALSLAQLLRPESLFWNTIASVTASVFDGGRRESERVQAEAYYEEMVVTYGKVVYQAVREVENGLFLVRASGQRHEAQAEATRASKRVLDAAVLAYQSGALDLASVLDARRSHQRQTDEWLRSKADALRAYVVLARALG